MSATGLCGVGLPIESSLILSFLISFFAECFFKLWHLWHLWHLWLAIEDKLETLIRTHFPISTTK